MLGLAAPTDPAIVADAGVSPWRVIEQAGWRLAYDSFGVVQGINLPTRFSAQRGAVRVRVIVDTWSPGTAAATARETAP
jgi:outer membrane biogenesis lipoprotein LolB